MQADAAEISETSPSEASSETSEPVALPEAGAGPSDTEVTSPVIDAGSRDSAPRDSGLSVPAAFDAGQSEASQSDTAQSDAGSLPVVVDSGVAPEASMDAAPVGCTAEGTWTLGDGNLFVVIDAECVITNFCDIANVIHSTGTLTEDELRVDSVGGQPMSFMYTLTADTLTMIDGFGDLDLPLTRTAADALPVDCFEPQ
jgi:hypothetical protein